MRRSRRLRTEASDRACVECQRRKTRCIVDNDANVCTYCHRTKKSCVFDKPPSRTPLTRKNLDAAEARCKELERLLRSAQPGIEVNSIEGSSDVREDQHSETTSNSIRRLSVPRHRSQPSQGSAELGFEWHETCSLGDHAEQTKGEKIQDGMVSIAASGYFGNSSGSSLLESISSLLSPPDRQSREGKNKREETILEQSHFPFFPLQNRLTGSAVQSRLLDAYFMAYNTSFPIVHERTFRGQIHKRSSIASQSPWNIVYYMVLAIGEWVSGYCVDDHSIYYEAAHARIRSDILESGNMTTVQAMLLLGNYLQKRDRPNTGYNFVGIAYRVALGLGLHRESSPTTDDLTFAHQRRRLLFWTLYCFESGFSLTTGRPVLVADSFIDIRKPKNIDDAWCETSSPLPPEVDYPTTCSAIIAQSRLAVIANKVYNIFLSAKPCVDTNHSVAIMEQHILNWRSSLPAFFFRPDVPKWFIGPRQIILWKEANLRILLLLAGQRQHTEEHEKIAIGVKYRKVALETIYDITEFCQLHADNVHMGVSWYAVYFLLQAALALCVHQLRGNANQTLPSLGDESDDPIQTLETAFDRAHQCLETLGRLNTAAARTLQIVERLHRSVKTHSGGSHSTTRLTRESQDLPHIGPIPALPEIPTAQNFPPMENPSTDYKLPSVIPGQEPSPDDTLTADVIERDWVGTIDPSLHMFLDDVDNIGALFQDLHGFPNTMEVDDFSYTTSGIQTMRTASGSQRPFTDSAYLFPDQG